VYSRLTSQRLPKKSSCVCQKWKDRSCVKAGSPVFEPGILASLEPPFVTRVGLDKTSAARVLRVGFGPRMVYIADFASRSLGGHAFRTCAARSEVFTRFEHLCTGGTLPRQGIAAIRAFDRMSYDTRLTEVSPRLCTAVVAWDGRFSSGLCTSSVHALCPWKNVLAAAECDHRFSRVSSARVGATCFTPSSQLATACRAHRLAEFSSADAR